MIQKGLNLAIVKEIYVKDIHSETPALYVRMGPQRLGVARKIIP